MEATIPVTIDAEAREYVEELGLTEQFQQMLDHALRTIAPLRDIHVSLQPAYDLDIPAVIIIATKSVPWTGDDPATRDFGEWKVNTFPPEVSQHFVLFVDYEAGDAR